MGSRYRKQEAIRVMLEDGEWLLLRKHLTAGEQREAFARVMRAPAMAPGERPDLDMRQLGLAQIVTYLLDWSITDADDQPILIRDQPYAFVSAALLEMTPEGFNEILQAVEAHDAAMVAEREHQKKTGTGTLAPSPISTSPG